MSGSDQESPWVSYRCPVCGHADGLEVRMGEGSVEFRCSHCEAPLEADRPPPGSEHLEVRVRTDMDGV